MDLRIVQEGRWRRAVALAGAIVLGVVLLMGHRGAPAQATTVNFEITSPSPDAHIYDSAVTVSGTGVPGLDVFVTALPPSPSTLSEVGLCSTTVGPDGTWTCSGGGLLAVSAGLTWKLWAKSGGINAPYVNITMHTPVTFSIDSPVLGSTVDTATPTISGHANPGVEVAVMSALGGSVLCTATAGADTVWSCTVSALADGYYSLPVMRGTSHEGDAMFTVEVPPTSPTITAPTSGASLPVGTVTVSGTADPGEYIRVITEDWNLFLCDATADPAGLWTCDWPTTPDNIGSYSIIAVDVYRAGTAWVESAPISFTVTVPVVTPVIESPVSGATVTVGTVVFSGTAGAGESVSVWTLVGGLRSVELCSATADANGDWECSFDAVPSDVGSHTVVVYTTVESEPVDVTIAAVPVDPLVVASPQPNSTVTTSTPTVSGTAAPGAEVSISLEEGGEPVCTTIADGSGHWSCTVSELPDGENTLYVSIAGGEATSLTITVTTSDDGGNNGATSPPKVLASTGTDLGASFGALGFATLTVLAGGALLLARTRRRSGTTR